MKVKLMRLSPWRELSTHASLENSGRLHSFSFAYPLPSRGALATPLIYSRGPKWTSCGAWYMSNEKITKSLTSKGCCCPWFWLWDRPDPSFAGKKRSGVHHGMVEWRTLPFLCLTIPSLSSLGSQIQTNPTLPFPWPSTHKSPYSLRPEDRRCSGESQRSLRTTSI